MNQTNYTILKLLFQQPLSEENLLNYLKINPLTLKKSISQLNYKLKNLQLTEIKVDKNIYSLLLTTVERDFFYNSCIDCSQEQRSSYLILKLLIEKNLNLEVEKDILNISRATINRDFCYIKKKLLEYKIPILSKKWEGIFLTSDETSYFYEFLCEQLIALHYEYNYLPKVLKLYLSKIQGEKIENLVELFFSIYDNYQIQIGEVSLNYFLSLKICFKYFPKFHLIKIDEYIKSLGKESSYHEIYENLYSKYNLEKRFG